MTETIIEVHRESRGTYGAPRVHAELRLGAGIRVGRKRVARLMRTSGIEGVYRRRRRGCTRRDPNAIPNDDLVNWRFTVNGPDKLWVSSNIADREFVAVRPMVTVEELELERSEEALGDGVIERVADSTHRPEEARGA